MKQDNPLVIIYTLCFMLILYLHAKSNIESIL